MKYKAIIFDVFGALVDNFSPGAYEPLITEIASVLSALGEDFVQLWSDTSEERMAGTIQIPEGVIRHICRLLDLHPTDTQIRLACEIRFNLNRREMSVRPDAVDTCRNTCYRSAESSRLREFLVCGYDNGSGGN